MAVRPVLDRAGFEVTPGAPVTIQVGLVNDGGAARTVGLRIVGAEPSWVEGLPDTIEVDAGARVDITVRITLPPGYPAGTHLFGVEVQGGAGERPALAAIELSVASIEGVSIRLSPPSVRGGWRGRFRVHLLNRGSTPITLKLSGRSVGVPDDVTDEAREPTGAGAATTTPKKRTRRRARSRALTFSFKPDEITLRPGERARTKGSVSGRRPTLGAAVTRPMTIVAQSNSAPLHAEARFTQRPLLSRRALRVVGMVVALALWAGGLVSAIRFSEARREETAAEASAELAQQQAEEEAAEAEQEAAEQAAEDAAEDAEGEQAGEPVGATISGQVSGLSDRSNVRVDLRPVSLADEIPIETELVAASKDSRDGKVFAQATGLEPEGPISPTASTTTDAEGFWVFAGLESPANYELTFSKAGFGTRSYVIAVDDEEPSVALEVAMEAGDGEISGTVTGPDGPLGGASIVVTDGVVEYRTTTPTTGAVGTWSVSGLATPASYLVTAELRGYGTEHVSVSLGGSESRGGVDIEMVDGVGSISGTISGEGQRLGGILVTAASEDVTRSVTTLTEDPVGSYSLPQLPIPGSYTITISGAGWISQTQLVELTGNDEGLDFELLGTTATLLGQVVGPDGPLSAVGVTVSQDDEPLVKTLTAVDPEGFYEVPGLQPGTYVVAFERFGYDLRSEIVELVAGDRKTVDATLAATPVEETLGRAVVHGIVRDASTGDPIDGVNVELGDAEDDSDEEGSFLLEELPAGTYEIELSHLRYAPANRTVQLALEDDITVDISMVPLGGVQGQVTDLSANPLEGVEVTITAQRGTPSVSIPAVTTDEDGEYAILQRLPTGAYVATFEADLFGSRRREFEATAGAVTSLDTTMIDLGVIAGSVQEPATGVSGGFVPVPDAVVWIDRVDVDPDVTVYGPVELEDGTFEATGLQPGDYVVYANDGDGGETFDEEVDDLRLRQVRDGGVVLVPGASEVNGMVFYLDASNNRVPIEGAEVSTEVVTGFDTLPVFPFITPILESREATTDEDGLYVIEGAVAGSAANYVVSAAGFVTRTVAITSSTLEDEGDIVLTPLPRTVEGTASATPAPGADITVTASLAGSALTTPPANQTFTIDAAGDGPDVGYSFDELQPGTYTVRLTSPGYHDETVIVVIPPGPSATSIEADDGELVEESDVSLTFHENTETGDAVEDILVTLSIPTRPSFTSLVEESDADGEVVFEELEAATYKITWSKTGYQSGEISSLTLTAGQHEVRDEVIAEFSTLSVDLQSNDDGVLSPLTGATVTGAPLAGGAVFSLTESPAASGTYVITGLTPGQYRISASKALHEAGSTTVDAGAGENDPVDLALDRYSDLTITVESDPTASADGDETALDGATVTAVPTTGGATLTLTPQGGGSGQYVAQDITPGSYSVTVTASNHVSRTVTRSPIAGSTTGNGTSVELLKHSRLTVSVFGDADFDSDALGDADDTDLNDDATVLATPTGGGSVLTLVAAAGTNDYSVSNVPPGDYIVTAAFDDHDTGTYAPSPVTQAAGVDQSVSILLEKHPPAYVLATDGSDTPLTGATVTATTEAGDTVAFTEVSAADEPGVYRASALAPGSNTIRASKLGFGSGSSTLVITAGVIPDLTVPAADPVASVAVVLEEDAAIVVDVFDSDDSLDANRLDDVEVSLRVLDDPTFATRHRYTGELAGASDDGQVTFSGLSAANDYRIRVSRAGYALQVFDIELDPGETHTQTVELLRLASLTVTVLSDPGGSALSGATVAVTPDAGGAGSSLAPTGITGVYIAPSMPYGGDHTITVSAPGHSSATQSVSITVGTNASATVNLSRYPTVAVQVNDDDGAPVEAIEDATVTITPTAGAAVVVGHSGSGLYQRALTDPGTYTLSVSKTGWATSTQSIVTQAGVAFSTVTVGLQPLRDLTVVVFSDSVDTGVSEVAGATVELLAVGTVPAETKTTDESGEVVFDDLPPGLTYSLRVSAPGHVTGTTNTLLANADSTLQVTIDSFPDVTVSVRSDDGTPAALSGATVFVVPADGGPGIAATETDTDGEYVARNVTPADDYVVTVAAPLHDDATVTDVDVVQGADESVGPVDLPAYPTLRVTVLSNDLSADPDDHDALTTATVTASPSDGGPVVNLAHAGSGVYTASGVLPSATYAVSVTDPTHADGSGTVVGTTGGVHSTSVTLDELPSVTVQVNDDDGAPVEGIEDATVTITPTAGGAALTLDHDADGAYTRAAVPEDSYTLRVAKSGWVTDTQTILTTAGEAFSTVTVGLQPERTVTIEVFADEIDDGVTELEGATVELLDDEGAVVASRTTPASGQAAFDGLTPGTLYTFRLSADGFVGESLSLTPVTTADTLRQEALLSNPDLTVTVRSDDGTPAALTGATVIAVPSDGGPAIPVLETSVAGTYLAENIDPGDDYVVTASAPLHVTQSVTDVDVVLGTDESVGPIDLDAYPTLSVTVLSNDLTAAAADDDLLTTATVTATPSDGGPVVNLAHAGSGVYSATGVLPSTTYAIAVSESAHASGSGSVSGVAGGVRTTSITLSELPSISVTVETDDGTTETASTGATVTLTPTAGGAALAVPHVGGPDGTYTRASIPAGTYTLAASVAGHESATEDVTVTAGSSITGSPFTLTLAELGSITLTVKDDDVGGDDLSDVDVDLLDPTTGVAVASGTTDADGEVSFSDLTPGPTYTLELSKSGFEPLTVTETLGIGEDATQTVALLRVTTLTVNVLADEDSDATGDTNVSGATVTATIAGGVALPVPEVSPGVYRLSPLPAGTYSVTATYPDHGSDTETDVEIESGDSTVVDLVLLAYPSLTVTLQSVVTVGSTEYLSELTNATVVADNDATADEYTLTHQGNGVYTGAIAVTGTYDIEISAPGHTSETIDGSAEAVPITITVGNADFDAGTEGVAAINGSVSGTVDVFGGADDSGVAVVASLNGVTVAASPASTLAAGTWTFSSATGNALAPGTWLLTFTKDTYGPLTVPVTVARGSAAGAGSSLTGVNRVIAPLGTSIIGSTTGVASSEDVSSGNPESALSAVTVAITAGPDTRPNQTVRSDGDGGYIYSFDDLDPGAYTLQFTHADYATTSVSVTVSAAQIATVSPTLVATERDVQVTAVDGATEVEGVVFRFTNADLLPSPDYVDSSATDEDGIGSVDDLPPGTYSVTVVTTPSGYVENDTAAATYAVPYVSGGAATYSEEFNSAGTLSDTSNGSVTKNDDDEGGSDGNAEGATVTISRTGYSKSTTVSATGTYTITNIPPQTDYTITYSLSGYESVVLTSQTITAGGTLTPANQSLNKLSTLTVTVVDDQGNALPVESIQLLQAANGATADDNDGEDVEPGSGSSYTFTNLDPGDTVHVQAYEAGYTQLVVPSRMLEAGDNTSAEGVTVTLVANASVDITVTQVDGTVDVTFDWTVLGVAGNEERTFTPTGGTDTVNGLPADTNITFAIDDTGGATCVITTATSDIDAEGTIQLDPGQTANLDLACT